jgi:2TM domain
MLSTPPDDQERYRRERRRVRQIRAFYLHFPLFMIVNIILHLINFLATARTYWVFWPPLGWGVGLLARGLATYRWMPSVGKEWEEQKIRELVDKDRCDASALAQSHLRTRFL